MMSVLDFARTAMGHTFFERTMRAIADGLTQLNTNIAALVAELREFNRQRSAASEAQHAPPTSIPSPGDIAR